MNHFDKDLKTYSENGMRSVEEWASLGRRVEDAAPPCAHASSRGTPVPLFTRAQTRPRPKRAAAGGRDDAGSRGGR